MSGLKSNIDKDFRSKGSKSLSSFKELKVNNKTFEKYRDQGIILSDLTGLDDSEFGRIFVDKDDKLVGYVICNDWGWITSIEVTPDYKGYGLGEQLLKYAMKNLGGNRLGVHKDNEIAYRLYKKNGFHEVSAKSIGGSGERGMIFMTTDKSIKEDCLEEANYVYKATEFGLTRPLATLINTKNQHKVIDTVLKNNKLSDKEKITELRKLKTKFKNVKTWRVNHGNLVPIVDKEVKRKICDTALNKIDKEIEKLGGVREDFFDLYGELCESTIALLEDEATERMQANLKRLQDMNAKAQNANDKVDKANNRFFSKFGIKREDGDEYIEPALDDFDSIPTEEENLEESCFIFLNEEYIEEANDGKDDKYVKEIDTIIAKDYKALTKDDLNTLVGDIKKINDNHLKAKYKNMAIDILVNLIIHGVIGVIAPPTLALLPISIAYCIMVGNVDIPENANKDMIRNINNLERARSEMQQKIFELKRKQKVGELSDDEEEILKVYSKNLSKLGDAIHGLKAATKRNAYGADLDESAEENEESKKTYLYENFTTKSINDFNI